MFWRYLVFLFCGLLAACQSGPPLPPPQQPVVLTTGLSPHVQNLNVSIQAFEANAGDINKVYIPLRRSESAYLPILLKETLIQSGYWGAVSVSPIATPGYELAVRATILESDALRLALKVEVTDSRGVLWFEKSYDRFANDDAYEIGNSDTDPFQDMYNQIANDLASKLLTLTTSDVDNILDVAMLQYANALSPQEFSRFLTTNESGEVQLDGLPARSSRMFQRVNRIREEEYKFADLMDDQYSVFYQEMQKVYPYWRRSSYELLAYNQKISDEGTKGNKPRRGSWAATEDIYKTYREFKMNEDELRELSSSFESEMKPTVTNFEGQVIELKGTLKEQYFEWREILRAIYEKQQSQLAIPQP